MQKQSLVFSSAVLKQRDAAWDQARKTKSETDWLILDCSTSLIKKAKSQLYLSETAKYPNDPRKLWETINHSDVTAAFVVKDSSILRER